MQSERGGSAACRCLRIGEALKKKVNQCYRYLQIDIDYVFQRMLLLKKKKYAALKVLSAQSGELTTCREVKGIDLVRRDWSLLSRSAGNRLLDILFTQQSRDSFRLALGDYLTHLARELRAGAVPLRQFLITKSLTHALKDYSSKSLASLPHVVVALRLQAAGRVVNAGDFIRYIVCVGKDAPPGAALSERVFTEEEVKHAAGRLQVGPRRGAQRSLTWSGTCRTSCCRRWAASSRRWRTCRARSSASAWGWSTARRRRIRRAGRRSSSPPSARA